MTKQHKLAVYLGAMLLLVAVGFLIERARGGDPVDARAFASTSPPPPAAGENPAPLDSGATDAKDGELRASVPEPAQRVSTLSFVFADTAASGLAIHRADTKEILYPLQVFKEPMDWSLRLNADGTVPSDQVATLGHIVAIRLDDHSIELVPIQSITGRCELTTLVSQAFVLNGQPPDDGTGITVDVRSASTDLISDWQIVSNASESASFANAFSVRLQDLEVPLTIAYCRLQLPTASGSIVIRLPLGDYLLSGRSAPFGWWIEEGLVHVTGDPIRLVIRHLPITVVRLKHDARRKLIIPSRVTVVCRQRIPETAESTGDLEVITHVSDDTLQIAISNILTDDPYSDFALRFSWADGTETTTEFGTVASLLRTVDLNAM